MPDVPHLDGPPVVRAPAPDPIVSNPDSLCVRRTFVPFDLARLRAQRQPIHRGGDATMGLLRKSRQLRERRLTDDDGPLI